MIDYGQMTANKDTAIINMLQDLVDSKESAEKQLCLLESVLSKNNIYFLLFDAAGSVCRHNIPDKKLVRLTIANISFTKKISRR